MAVYTLINSSQLKSLLAYYELGELVEYKPIQAGTTNSNYEFTVQSKKSSRQKKYILTIVEQNLSKKDLDFCLDFAKHLENNTLPCAAPVPDRSGLNYRSFLDKRVLVTPFVSGASVLPGSKELEPKLCRELGFILAKMHIAGCSFGKTRKNPAGLKWCLDTFDRIEELLAKEQRVLINEELSFLLKTEDLVSKSSSSVLVDGAIHADLFCDNIIFDNSKLQGIIDFYYSCTDHILYDLAIVVNDWAIAPNGELNKELYNSLIENYSLGLQDDNNCYNKIKDNLLSINELWGVMLRRAALRFWLLRLLSQYFQQDSSVKNVKDPTEYELKLILHRENTPKGLNELKI